MRKTLRIIKNIFVCLIMALALCIMIFTIISTRTFDRSDRSLFGYKAFVILSDSMSKTDFSAGDVALIKEVDPATLKEGDIISYTSQNPENFGATVTHKIRKLTTTLEGEPGFITYGTTTNTDDEGIVTYEFVLGKYQTHIPKLGTFFQFLKTTPGYIFCILLPFSLLILLQGINCFKLFRLYKKEQKEEMDKEREMLKEEREKSQKMMDELLELKAQLAQREVEQQDNLSTDSKILDTSNKD